MSAPSKWPLPAQGVRFLTPRFMTQQLAVHPLTEACYPTAMGYYPDALGHRMARQRHDDNLLIYCTNGGGQLITAEWCGSVRAGEVAMLPQGSHHVYEADPDNPWSLYWVHFQGHAARNFFSYLGYEPGHPVVYAGVSSKLHGAFTSLMEVRRTGYSTTAFVTAANRLRHLLSLIAEEINAQKGRLSEGSDVSGAQAFMLENLTKSLTLEEIAASAGMSKFHFSKRYKALTGYSPIKHFLNMKVEHACVLLDGTDLKVSEIAARLGFEDPLYFSRLFRRVIGQSPRAYRASIR